MDDLELKALIQHRVTHASSTYGVESSWQSERLRADRYYKGDPRGDEQEGRSSVVSHDIAEVVDSIMPSLMRIFASGDKVVEFQPNGPEDEDAAKQATDYINWVFNQQNPGFRVLHDWFKDGLLHRLGVVKIWWDTTPVRTTERYRGLTEEEASLLSVNEDIEVVRQVPAGFVEFPTGQIDPQTGQPVLSQQPIYDVVARRRDNKGRIRIAPVPPEEFLIEARSKGLELDNFNFAAHQVQRRASDLIDEGYSKELIDQIGSDRDLQFTEERLERFSDETQMPYSDEDIADPSLRLVTVYECYLRVDYDDDGIAELRKVTVAGNVILENEEIDDHPFVGITPNLLPHKLIGKSIADDLFDIQDIKTTLWRQMLDNVYLANNSRTIVVDGQVNLDDLLTVRPGGIVRAKQPGAIQPFPFQGIVRDAYQLIEYSDTLRENRTGITRYNQGLDANTLNKTATGITQIMDAARQRQELIARIYAEGVAVAFKKILRLVCQYQDYAKVIRLRGKYVTMDPRSWSDSYDATVTVGLGTGNRDQQIIRMMQLIDLDLKLLQAAPVLGEPLVTPSNIYNKLAKIIEASGLKSPEAYYTDPGGEEAQRKKLEAVQAAQAQGQQPTPQQQQFEAQMQMEQAKLQADLQAQQAKTQADIENMKMKTQADIETRFMSAKADIEIERFKAEQAAQQPQIVVAA